MNPVRTEAPLMLGLLLLLFSGCETTTTGGNSPVTSERLAGSTLVDIRESVTWKFEGDSVVIDNKGQPIPSDRVGTLLAEGATPKQIEAKWRFNQQTKTIDLLSIVIDDKPVATKVSIPIRPAGHVRVNLGFNQYNMFRDAKNRQ